MGKQINYWMGYEDFLHIAQAALDCGCVIIKSVSGKLVYGKTLNIVTKEEHYYYFFVPEAGELTAQKIPFDLDNIGGYSASGITIIEAGFSFQNEEKKKITRSRLFAISGYYDDSGAYIARPECLTKIYHKLARVVRKVAPYTELTDTYVSTRDNDYLQEREYKHKEYLSPSFLELKVSQGYKLCQ